MDILYKYKELPMVLLIRIKNYRDLTHRANYVRSNIDRDKATYCEGNKHRNQFEESKSYFFSDVLDVFLQTIPLSLALMKQNKEQALHELDLSNWL